MELTAYKDKLEEEMGDLTVTLFEEANEMVQVEKEVCATPATNIVYASPPFYFQSHKQSNEDSEIICAKHEVVGVSIYVRRSLLSFRLSAIVSRYTR
jgi:capsular polysaccharide biosynthesis protein